MTIITDFAARVGPVLGAALPRVPTSARYALPSKAWLEWFAQWLRLELQHLPAPMPDGWDCSFYSRWVHASAAMAVAKAGVSAGPGFGIVTGRFSAFGPDWFDIPAKNFGSSGGLHTFNFCITDDNSFWFLEPQTARFGLARDLLAAGAPRSVVAVDF